MCSTLEAPDVRRKVANVSDFPFEQHVLTPGVEVVPIPGHRPGAVCYLVDVGSRRCLFAGDTIYHDGKRWRALASKKNRKTMLATLDRLAALPFDVLFRQHRRCQSGVPCGNERECPGGVHRGAAGRVGLARRAGCSDGRAVWTNTPTRLALVRAPTGPF